MYVAEAKTGLENVLEPTIRKVPFAIVRKPAVLAPCTVIVPPGKKSSIEEALVPLFRVMPFACRRSRDPELTRLVFVVPVNTIPAPAVSVFVLKSVVPAFVRPPPRDSTCPV